MRRVLFLILLSMLLAGTLQAQSLCGLLFNEGSAEFVVCTDYHARREKLLEQDLRMRVIGQRVTNLLSSMQVNSDDAEWVERIRPAIGELADEYQTLFDGLQLFLAGEVFLVRTALDDRADSVPEKLRSPLMADLDYFDRDLYAAWVAVGSDLDLLNRDLNDAILRLASQEDPETNGQQEAVVAPEADAPAGETALALPTPRSVSAREIVTSGESACEGAAEGRELESCIFREAWINLNAADYCDDGNDDLCEEMRIWFFDYSEEMWEQLVEEYGATEDARAGIAVLICQLNPATREDGSVVPLGTCAQVEYLGLTGVEAGPVSNGPTEEDTDAAGNADWWLADMDTIPSVGEWMMTFLGDCGGDAQFIEFVEASAERILVAEDIEYVVTTPGTYVNQVQDDSGTAVTTLIVIPGQPGRMTGRFAFFGNSMTMACPLELVRLGEDG